MVETSHSAWKDLVDRVRRHRASRVYMPAALLAAIDVVAAHPDQSGRILFEDFDERFRELMRSVSGSGSARGWQPFFHLSQGVAAWALLQGAVQVSFGERPKSRRALVGHADGAQLAPELFSDLQVRGPEQARSLICGLLRGDDEEDSAALLRSAERRSAP